MPVKPGKANAPFKANAPGKAGAKEGPSVATVIDAMAGDDGRIMSMAQGLGLALPGADERTVYDGFCREWTPAYYLAKRQIFHVHVFKSGIRGSMFVGVRALEPLIMASCQAPGNIKDIVANTRGGSGAKMIKALLATNEDVAGFGNLVRVRWEFELERLGPAAAVPGGVPGG